MRDAELYMDLGRWELDELSLDELEARHPGEDVRGAVEAHGLLTALADQPVPDLDDLWEELRVDLPDRVEVRPRGARSIRRLALAIAATLALGGTAYAAAPNFWQERFGDLRQGVDSILGDPESAQSPPTQDSGTEPDGQAPVGSRDDGSDPLGEYEGSSADESGSQSEDGRRSDSDDGDDDARDGDGRDGESEGESDGSSDGDGGSDGDSSGSSGGDPGGDSGEDPDHGGSGHGSGDGDADVETNDPPGGSGDDPAGD